MPGVQIPCQASESGQPIRFPLGVPKGRCRLGIKTCRPNGVWGLCLGAVGPLAKDECVGINSDDNCDGVAAQGCECVDVGTARRCGTGVGQCEPGEQHCVGGRWGPCQNEIGPGPEICDGQGVDEDCDGKVDLLDEQDCQCLVGETMHCEVPGARGDCALGVKRCDSGQWTACESRFSLDIERCGDPRQDSLGAARGDEDCDGEIDEYDPDSMENSCEIFMVDRDGDGYGAIGPSYKEDPQRATWGCFCPNNVLIPNAVPAKANRHNRDCGDCSEEIANDGMLVRPGTKTYYEEPSACLSSLEWRGGAFDYNCDGIERQLYLGVLECGFNAKDECEPSNSGHWYSPFIPRCGEVNLRVVCEHQKSQGEAPRCKPEIAMGFDFTLAQRCQ